MTNYIKIQKLSANSDTSCPLIKDRVLQSKDLTKRYFISSHSQPDIFMEQIYEVLT